DRRTTGDVASPVMLGAVAMSLAWAVSAPASLFAPRSATPEGGTEEWRGRVVCLDETGGRRACGAEARRFGPEAKGGGLQPVLASDPLAGIFRDPPVREPELLVRARRGRE